MNSILEADDAELFEVKRISVEMPEPARIYKTVTCGSCGEKTMEPRTRMVGDKLLCIPCSKKNNSKF